MKKYILTGGPGSGKSSIILDLEQRGEYCIREAAEDIIKYMQAIGIKEPWLGQDFQERITGLQIQREQRTIEGIERIFIDRGISDGIAYCKMNKQEFPEEMLQAVANAGYEKKVFLIENLGHCKNTTIRHENLEQSLLIERFLEETYFGLGCEIIRVPSAPVIERTNLILNALGDDILK